jgi:tetratricopeptide (TPR) repeat protein/O-antigen ligase
VSTAATDNLTAADPKPDAGLMISVSFLLIAVPFAYSHSVFDTGLMPKFLALMIGSIFVVLSWLRMEYRGEAFRVSLPTDLPIFLYLLIVALQWPRAYDVYQASLEVIKVFTFTAIYMAITRCSVPAHWRAWTSILVVVGTIVSAIGICQYLGVGFLWLPSAGFPSGTFGYRNTAAMFIITVLPFAILKFAQAEEWLSDLCWVVCWMLMAIFLIYTRTRGAWVGAMFSGTVALALFLYRDRRIGFRLDGPSDRLLLRLRKGLIVFGSIALIAGASTTAPSSHVFEQKRSSPLPPEKQGVRDALTSVVLSTSELSKGIATGGSGRAGMWRSTLSMIQDYPLVGVGLTNWEKVYSLYRSPEDSKTRFPRRPHNDYLWAWAELGIFGFVIYAAVIVVAIVSVLAAVKRPGGTLSGTSLAAVSGFLALQTHALFSFPRERPGVLLAGTVCIALTSAAGRKAHRRGPTRSTLGVALTATVLVALGGIVVNRAYVSETLTLKASAAKSAGVFDEAWSMASTARQLGVFDYKHLAHLSEVALTMGHRDSTYQICREAVSRHPNSVNNLLGLGRVGALVGEYDVAVDAYKRALLIRPDRFILFKELGDTFERIGRYQDVLKTYKQAQSHGHSTPSVLCKSGEMHFQLGELDQALAYFKRAQELQSDYARAVFGIGNVQLVLGEQEAAIHAYRTGLDLEGDNAKAHYILATLYISQGKRSIAVGHLRAALVNTEDEALLKKIHSLLE